MKKKIFLILTLVLFLFSPRVMALEGISADVYYFESLEEIGYKISPEEFKNLSAEKVEQISTKLRAYSFYRGLKPIEREDFVLVQNTYEGKTFLQIQEKTLNFNKKGFYLLVFENKKIDNLLVSARDLLIYYDENTNVRPKIDSSIIENDLDLSSSYLDVIFDMNGFKFSGPLYVGLYDADGNLLDRLVLDESNNYRGRFSGLNPLKNYGVWPENLDIFDFLEYQIGNTVYIRLLRSYYNGEIPEDTPGWIVLDPEVKDEKIEVPEEKPEEPDEKNPEDEDKEPLLEKESENERENEEKPLEKQKLPQTGLLWLPVPFLFGAGIIFLALARKNDED